MPGRDDSADERARELAAQAHHAYMNDPVFHAKVKMIVWEEHAELRRQLAEARAENERLRDALLAEHARLGDATTDAFLQSGRAIGAERALAEAHRKLDEARDIARKLREAEDNTHDAERIGELWAVLGPSRPAAPVADDEPATCVHGKTGPHYAHHYTGGGECPGPVSSAEPGGTGSYDQPGGRR